MATGYDLKKVSVVWGSIPILGLAKDSAVQITYSNDFSSVQVSGDGRSNTFTTMNDRSAEISVTISQNSISNALLSAQFIAQESGGVAPAMSITDLNTGAAFVAEACRLKKLPDATYGEEAQDRTWVFVTDYLDSTLADAVVLEGNSP
jgi:hypothetical protein